MEQNSTKRFTDKEILQALSRMDEEHRSKILALEFKSIDAFVNDVDGTIRKIAMEYLDYYIDLFTVMKESFLQLSELLETKSDDSVKIKSILEWYEEFDSKQKLLVNAGLSERNSLHDSLNCFHYSWNKLFPKRID